jgi:hypothetical protein
MLNQEYELNFNTGSQYAAMYYVTELLCGYWCTIIDAKGEIHHFIECIVNSDD